MGFLALAALSAGIAPMLFPLPGSIAGAIAVGEWLIIALFAVEYLVQLALAHDRRRFVPNPWRMVDAALRESSYPRLVSKARWCAFALSLPAGTRAPRSPVLLLVSKGHLLSLTLHPADLQAPPAYEDVPWGARCALHVINSVLER